MRGFSLTQPWATLVAIGSKRIETRSWSTAYRGDLLIHAAKGFPRYCQELRYDEPFRSVLMAAGFNTANDLPRGVIVAMARLTGVARTEDIVQMSQGLLQHEIEFGDYGSGRYGWVLADVQSLTKPVPAAHVDRHGVDVAGGALGLWRPTAEVLSAVAAQKAVA